ncbi:MAG: protein kinase domain-containing protein [Candidatus Rifleibacteriota bacterium]
MGELANEQIYAGIGIILVVFAIFVFLIKRKKQTHRVAAPEAPAPDNHREEIIAAAASGDSRAISRAIPIATGIAKNSTELVNDGELLPAICRLLYLGGQKSLCQQLMNKISSRYSDKEWFLNLEIEFLTEVKKLDEKTVWRIQDLIKRFPEDSRLHITLANHFDKRKTYKAENLPSFLKASAFEPGEPRWLYAVARCQQNLSHLTEAQKALNDLLELSPNFPGAQDLKRVIDNLINPPKPKPAHKAAPSASTGFSVERYSQVSEMGRGGMGIVYKAFDEVLQRWVAIKTLQESLAESQPEIKQRFLGEARILAALDHGSIPKVFDLSLKPPYYLAFELINGRSLRDILNRNQFIKDTDTLFQMATEIASALAYAESKSILHRDIKPENILVDAKGHCFVIDFGLAQFEGQQSLTKTGMVMGTPWYLAPERFRGDPASIASEIYSLGIMLYEMIEGNKPYEGDDINVVLVQEPKAVTRADIPGSIKVLVGECLSKNPANRPENFKEISQILDDSIKKLRAQKKDTAG